MLIPIIFSLMHLSILNVSILTAYTPTGISLFEKNLVENPCCSGSGDAPFDRTLLSFRCTAVI